MSIESLFESSEEETTPQIVRLIELVLIVICMVLKSELEITREH